MLNHRTLSNHIILIAFIFLALIGVFYPTRAGAEQSINVIVNGRQLISDVAPIRRHGRVFLPARAVADALMMNIKFTPETRFVSIWNDRKAVSLLIGHNEAFIFDDPFTDVYRTIPLDAPTFIHNGRTMIPLRFVSEIFAKEVSWDNINRTVIVSSPRPMLPVKATAYLPVMQTNPNRRLLSPEEVVALIEPATVQILLLPAYGQGNKGSGFVVTSNGLIMTNAHVVRGAGQIHVTFKNGERFLAEIIKLNNMSDLALLKIKNNVEHTFPYVRYRAYRSSLLAGDRVMAFGHPGGKEWYISHGAILGIQNNVLAAAWTKKYPLIHHNAYTNPGSSGGIVVNMYGEWIGTHALGGEENNQGFAVPVDYVYELLGGSYFGLACDIESYWTEYFAWESELARAEKLFEKGLRFEQGSTDQANAWKEALFIIKAIRSSHLVYAPMFPELMRIPSLFLSRVDSIIAYYTYLIDVLEGRLQWSQIERERLWNVVVIANDVYVAEFNRVRSLAGVAGIHKASLP